MSVSLSRTRSLVPWLFLLAACGGFGSGGGAPAAEAVVTGGGESARAVGIGAMPPPGGAPGVDAAPIATTVTTTTTTTVTVDVAVAEPVVPQQPQQLSRLLTAATVGDSDRRGPYLDFLSRHPYEASRLALDMSRRVRFRVLDRWGRPVHDASILISGQGREVHGRTHADGTWDFFPGVSAPELTGRAVARIGAGQAAAQVAIDVPAAGDGQDLVIRLSDAAATAPQALDLAFVIDVTGSMEDELRYVNAEVSDIVQRIRSEVPEIGVRVGAVFYRDRGDPIVVQKIDFTSDVAGFARAMQRVHAEGGGDYPEDLNRGLEVALHSLAWSSGPAVRVMTLIADAPPQRWPTQVTYREAMIDAAQRGIRILPVAASGADREVEFLFRAMGTFTSTPYVYLTDDSGIGNPHLDADTDRVAVEYFNDLLTRLVISDLRGHGMHEPGAFGPNG